MYVCIYVCMYVCISSSIFLSTRSSDAFPIFSLLTLLIIELHMLITFAIHNLANVRYNENKKIPHHLIN